MDPMVAAEQHHAELQQRQMGLWSSLLGSDKVKALSIISLFLLLGCAPSTPDLIEQAHLTGDWSLVNKRMEAIERREARNSMSCPRGTTKLCNSRFGEERCSCVRNAEMREMFGSLEF